MSTKITQRDALEAFFDLEERARLFAAGHASASSKLQLHDAAMRYARIVRRVARAGRDQR